MRCVDEVAAADVHPHVAETAEEDEVAGCSWSFETGDPSWYCAAA
jgi:hypothetical protein